MKKSSRVALKVWLEKAPDKDALEAFLPSKERLFLAELPSFDTDNPFIGEEILNEVHWSWFLPTFKAYSETEQKLFLSALDTPSRSSLAKTLDLLDVDAPETPALEFFRTLLLESLIDPKDPPCKADCLSPSRLDHLLRLSKKELIDLIDALSLYDLAAELRQIVETKILKKIYSLLSEKEKRQLKAASAHKETFSLGRLNLEKWDESESKLRSRLHRKGLARLAIALSGEGEHFIWHVCHQLDIGRGGVLCKLCEKQAPQTIRDQIVQQVEELL